MTNEAKQLAAVIATTWLPTHREKNYGEAIAAAAEPLGWKLEPEHRTRAGRVDFRATTGDGTTIAIELKVRGAAEKAFRQIGRYLEFPCYDQGIIVTAKPYDLALDAWECADGNLKPVSVVETWGSALP